MQAPLKMPDISAALARTAGTWPERGVHFYDRAGVKSFVTWAQIQANAQRAAQGLHQRGVVEGERVLITLPSGFEFIYALLGAIQMGAHPVPTPMPSTRATLSVGLGALNALSERVEARTLLGPSPAVHPLMAMAQAHHHFERSLNIDELLDDTDDGDPTWAARAHEDVAIIQCTSGTTGTPKGVALTHGQILTNLTDIGQRIGIHEDDVGVSWLPMVHDMGLVGVLLFAMCWGVPLVLLHPERFLKAPHEWLWCVHNHGGTLSPASDFGFHHATRRARRSDLEGLDLSSWRVAMNGSEVVQPAHVRAFERRFAPYGLKKNIITPVYGLAEATVAVTFGTPGQPLRVDKIDRVALETQGAATPADDSSPHALEIASVGAALPHVNVTLRDMSGETVEDRVVGEICVSGDSVSTQYTQSDDADAQPQGPWITTGDLGYTVEGEIFVLGRRREAINLGHRVVHPSTLETLVGRIDGVRPNAVAAFGVHRAAASKSQHSAIREVARRSAPDQDAPDIDEDVAFRGPELLIVAAEVTQGVDTEHMTELITYAVEESLGLRPDDVHVLPSHTLPRTSAGKVQHFECRRLYLQASLNRPRAPKTQSLSGITERARSYVTQLGRRVRTYFNSDS